MTLDKALPWFLLAATTAALNSAGAAPARIGWGEFSSMMTPKHTVRMVLPDGTHIEGKPLQVTPDAIEMRVTRTSNAQAHPKGKARIPRESFSVVDVRRPRRAGKLIGTLVPIGIGAAVLAGGIYGNQGSDSVYGYAAAGGLTMGVGAPAGYLVGRAIDRRFEQFVIAPRD